MLAYHNDPKIKAYYLERVRAHRLADELRHGVYWQAGKGCAVGCTIHGSDHAAYEKELGIPTLLARLEDGIFESLPSPEDLAWPEEFLDAVPVGATLSMVWPQFAFLLLSDQQHGVLRYVQEKKHVKKKNAIEKIIIYYQQWVDSGIKPAAAYAAADAAAAAAYAAAAADAAAYADAYTAAAAYAAAATAAYAAYAADAADAADAYTAIAYTSSAASAAADAYASTDGGAASAAADAADAARIKRGARVWQAQTLLQLLRDAPVSDEKETL